MGRQEGRQTQFDHRAMLLSATQWGWIKAKEIGGWEGTVRGQAGISEGGVISSALLDLF